MMENLLNINKIIDNIIKRNNILNNCLADFIDLLIFNIFKLIEGKNNKEKNKKWFIWAKWKHNLWCDLSPKTTEKLLNPMDWQAILETVKLLKYI